MAKTYLTSDNSHGNPVTAANPSYAHIRGWNAGVHAEINREGTRVEVYMTGGSNHPEKVRLGSVVYDGTLMPVWVPALDSGGHEYAVTVPAHLTVDESSTVVCIDKTGGGTVGESYEGTWSYEIRRAEVLLSGDDLHTGIPKTHEQVARIAASYLADALSETDQSVLYDQLTLFAGEI